MLIVHQNSRSRFFYNKSHSSTGERPEIGHRVDDLLAGAPRAFRHLYLSEGGQFAEITLVLCFGVVELRRWWGGREMEGLVQPRFFLALCHSREAFFANSS